MKRTSCQLTGRHRLAATLVFACGLLGQTVNAADPLPSWNPTPTKQSITSFVARVTDQNSQDFVPVAERIAVFDNDGTLWTEQPFYFQLAFALDRVQALAPQHPEWKDKQPFQAALKRDVQSLVSNGGWLMEVILTTHAGMTTEEFDRVVREWIATARHAKTKRLYTEMVYQPMLELLGYLRANGFKTWIVSGGGIEFMRPWADRVYGIPPEQVVGSTVKQKFEIRDGKPVLVRTPEFNFINNANGKPIAISRHIGRRPIAAFGNSDGDLQMLRWTTAGKGPRLALIVHHTDAEREWAYDRKSTIGQLDKALDVARARGWTLANMKRDWKVIYPPAK